MFGKIIKFLLICFLAVVVFAIASIAGARNDVKKSEKSAAEEEAALAEANAQPKAVSSPYERYAGGVLELQMDYDVQTSGDDIYVSIVTNLPDGYDLSAELTNIEDVKKQLGFENIAASALSEDQMSQINERTYSAREKNFVTNGVCSFLFRDPPSGQLEINVTSPITKLQPSSVQELLGEQGVNLQGPYVVFLEEVADKSINYTESFLLSDEVQQ